VTIETDLAANASSASARYARGRARIANGEIESGLDDLRHVADGGHVDAGVEAARVLMYLYSAEPQLAEAVARLETAENAGHRVAPYLLALLALGGTGMTRDFVRINQRLHASAERGHPQALRAVALMLGGNPDPRAQEVALQLFVQAAEAGDVVSARLLAERWRRGEGCVADPAAAQSLQRQLRDAGVGALPATAPHVLPTSADFSALPQLSTAASLLVPAAEMLNDRPRVARVDGLFSAEDCRFVIAMAEPHLRRSQVLDPSLGIGSEHAVRNSSDAAFDPLLEDFYLRLLQLRMAAAAGCELVQGEQLIVLRYQPGERYLPHRDYFSPGALAAHRPDAGQRMVTVCVYLNPVSAGGGTDFPELGIRVDPRPGAALIFDNLDAAGAPEPASLHAGLAVEAGEKWLATLWIRQGRYRMF
jgi:hypothetical protein